MTRYNVLANSNDGFLRGSATVVDDAQEGAGGDFVMEVQNGLTVLHAGQKYEPSNGRTYVTQYFQEFTHTVPAATEMVTSACYKLHGLEHVPTGDPWSLQVRDASDWDGGDPVASDFVGKSDLSGFDLLAEFPEIRTRAPKPVIWRAGSAALRTAVTEAAPLRLFAHSNKQLLGFAAGGTGDEFTSVGAFEGAAGPFRPRLEYSTAVRSSLTRCSAGEAQLRDGTVAFLEFESDTLYLRHRTNAGVEITIDTVPVGLDVYQFSLQNGAQAFSLTVDVDSNLYVLGPAGSLSNGIQAMAWVKGSGYAWQSKFALPHQLPDYDQPVNQVVGTWHSAGTGDGYLVVVAAHMQGYTMANQTMLVTLSAQSLLEANAALGPGNVAVAHQDVTSQYLGAPINACGAGLDIVALSQQRGILAGATFDHGQSDSSENRGNVSVYTYEISGSGQFLSVPTKRFTTDTAGQVKADGRIRAKLLPISSSRFALLCAGTLSVYTSTTPASVQRVGGFPWLQNSGLTAYPQNESGEAAAHPQDAIYDRASRKVFVYYPDTANSRRIMRTGFDTNTGLLDLAEVQVETNTGPSGSSNVTLRTPRGVVDERFVQVHLGNRSGAGALDLVHVGDLGLDQAPNAPALNPVSVFSAQNAKTVTWTYSDNNPDDSQSAFQLQIRDQSSAVTVLDTGKVVTPLRSYTIAASTLSNNETYEWRVRTYDTSDVIGAYSAFSVFSTTTVGVAEITDPATDNPPGLTSPTLTITWTYTASGAQTQARYAVNVLRTDTGASLFDSGFIAGPEVRTYTIAGLISDVEQQIELVVEDNTGELSNTALRLVTPVFSGPDQPSILVQPSSDGAGIEVAVINPDPTGDLPAALQNDIYRADADSGVFVKIGESQPNSIFIDYAVAAGQLYDYQVYAVADGQTASEVAEDISTEFHGLYIHDPVDAVSTIRHFLYGRSLKSSQAGARVTEHRFVGRSHPVFEFGDQLSQSVSVVIEVPDIAGLAAWRADLAYLDDVAQSRTVQCYRDSRGRKVFGVVTEASTSDEDWGSTVSFAVTRADFSEEFDG